MKWIPISYCQFLIESNSFGAGKLFCYLKYHSDGIVTSSKPLEAAGNYFGVSDRTLRRWMNQAQYYNWIGENQETGTLFVRGWQYLFDTLHFPKKTCFRFRKKDLKNFKTYCYAAVISHMARRTQVKELERSRRRIDGRSHQALSWVPMASSAIAKTLNVSKRTAQTYRQKAVDLGYIKKKSNLKPFHIKVNEINQFKKYAPFEDKHLVVRGGKVYEQLPDLVLMNKENVHSPRRLFVNPP